MEPLVAKWLSALLLLLLTFFVGFFPAYMFGHFAEKRRQRRLERRAKAHARFSTQNVHFFQGRSEDQLNSAGFGDDDLSNGSTEQVMQRRGSVTSLQSSIASRAGFSSTKLLQIFMFFGGGVLLATCFCHLIPETRENYDSYMSKHGGPLDLAHSHAHSAPITVPSILNDEQNGVTYADNDSITDHSHELEHTDSSEHLDHNHAGERRHSRNDGHTHVHDEDKSHKHGIPWVEVSICAGFFFIYLLEEIVHTLVGHHSHGLEEPKKPPPIPAINSTKKSRQQINPLPLTPPSISGLPTPSGSPLTAVKDKSSNFYDNYAIDLQSEPTLNNFTVAQTSDSIESLHSNETSIANNEVPISVRFLRGLVIIVAFSAHSVFDGLAVGLQGTESQIFTMLFAILLHKLVVAFAVGLQLFEETASLSISAFHMFLFSSMSPLGVLIVIATQGNGLADEDSSLVLILMSAVATGTILYIVFFEILKKDEKNHVNGFLLWATMLGGFLLMLAVTAMVEH